MARKLSRLLVSVALLTLAPLVHAQTSVTIAWDPNPEPDVRYVVWWGTEQLGYTSSAAAGSATSYSVAGLTPGQTYYFAVQAATGDGLLSPFSEEVSAAIPSDRKPDILWHNQKTGGLYRWLMDGTTLVGGARLQPGKVSPDWRLGGVADFNADGEADVLWHNQTTGVLYLWFMKGAMQLEGRFLTPQTVPPEWQVCAVVDFSGDGKPDILWHNQQSGLLYLWYMDGTTQTGASCLNPTHVPPSWQIRGAADFTGDGKPDILWHNQLNGMLYLWQMDGVKQRDGLALTPASVSPEWQASQVSDFNEDESPDILWHNQSSGALYLWLMNGTQLSAGRFLSEASVSTEWQVRQ